MNWPRSDEGPASSRRPADPGTRALVLAGGGAAGNAWVLGVIAGLARAGTDVTAADLVVGTSSGATAAAQITGGSPPADLYAAILDETPPPQRPGGAGPGRGLGASGETFMRWSDEIIASAADAAQMRRLLGAAAIGRATGDDGSAQARWRETVAARFPARDWPRRCVLVTAIDADTGEPVAFDRDAGVDLVDAVAASTSNGFGPFGPYRIGTRRYLDGGYRRSENADLAAGYGRVLVLSPFGGRSRMPAPWRMDLAAQVEDLRAGGSRVETVFPDSRAGDVFGSGALDPATRRPAAVGGEAQGRDLAERLDGFWN